MCFVILSILLLLLLLLPLRGDDAMSDKYATMSVPIRVICDVCVRFSGWNRRNMSYVYNWMVQWCRRARRRPTTELMWKTCSVTWMTCSVASMTPWHVPRCSSVQTDKWLMSWRRRMNDCLNSCWLLVHLFVSNAVWADYWLAVMRAAVKFDYSGCLSGSHLGAECRVTVYKNDD